MARTKNFRKKKRRTSDSTTYESLEARKLLATMVYGSENNDTFDIRYVNETTVDVFRNGVLEENVDISEGLIVNLAGGDQDKLILDPRISGKVSIVNAETLELTGSTTNFFIISELEDGRLAGRVGRVGFADVKNFITGDGTDFFLVNTAISETTIDSGGGNDHFVLYAHSENGQPAEATVDINGGTGDDRFHFELYSSAFVTGGDGTDVVDYRDHLLSTHLDVVDLYDAQLERVLGSQAGQNKLIQSKFLPYQFLVSPPVPVQTFDSASDQNSENSSSQSVEYASSVSRNVLPQYTWNVSNEWITIRNGDTKFELQGFYDLDTGGHDGSVFVFSTSQDLSIAATEVIVGSKANAEIASLDTIRNAINITPLVAANTWSIYPQPFDGHQLRSVQSNLTLDASQPTVDHNSYYQNDTNVTLNNKGGTGVTFVADENRIEFSSGGSVSLAVDYQVTQRDYFVINGSENESDYILVNGSMQGIRFEGNGGDDSVFLGSTNEDANGSLSGIKGTVWFNGGSGNNQIYLNDQGNQQINREIEMGRRQVSVAAANEDDPFLVQFEDVGLVKVNGSKTLPTEFLVAPSRDVRFLVDGGTTQDRLRINGLPDGAQINQRDGRGSWGLDEAFERIYFEGIEFIQDNIPFVEDGSLISELNLRPLKGISFYDLRHFTSSFTNDRDSIALVESQADRAELVERLRGNFDGDYVNAINELNIDFAESNLLFVKVYKPTAGIDLVLVNAGVVDGVAEIDFDGQFEGDATAAVVGWEIRAFQVSKSVEEFVLHSHTDSSRFTPNA